MARDSAVTSWAVPIDKTNITERVRAIQKGTNPRPFILENEWGLFLATILIAIGRARRGELLIADQGVGTRALNHALGFLLDFVVTLGILDDELLLQSDVLRKRLGWGITPSEVQSPSQHHPD